MVAAQTDKNRSAHRLAQAVKQADNRMQPFRESRVKFIREYAGPYY
ncbi:hypothetical protein LCGC14_2775180, partial [marine sediment metagenome]